MPKKKKYYGDIEAIDEDLMPTIPASVAFFYNAQLVYSLRQINSIFPYCVEVRRDSDNTTRIIGFKNGVIDTVDLIAFTGVANGFVKTWYDQSTHGFHAVQATNGNQPRIVNAGAVETSNGKPSIKFITANSTFMLTPSIELSHPTNGAWIGLCVMQGTTNNTEILWSGDNNLGAPVKRLGQFIRQVGLNYGAVAFNTGGGAFACVVAKAGFFQTILHTTRRATANNVQITQNGVIGAATATAGAPEIGTLVGTIGALNRGSSSFYDGHLQEIVHLNNDNTTIRDLINNSMRTFYGSY